ncbi:hypothetical protein [Tepidibacter thalassicus]|uniref:Uncharacterized protein n=1 Tax=Tepidibacter thalassicus DSM 15285 TaxID=1123350 RepID=A0A1M5TZY7_9FIRM|nr:hypothetical protein [Tepidibacter thalassicus]SHH56191.1 hypothetical protein SAMN02744040_02346 [Tepidibacter thalassicus DSM 15285]
MNDKLNHLKKLYEDGYRCIYYDSNKNEVFTVYLKNFEQEKSEVIEIENPQEFNEFKSYIDDLKIQ